MELWSMTFELARVSTTEVFSERRHGTSEYVTFPSASVHFRTWALAAGTTRSTQNSRGQAKLHLMVFSSNELPTGTHGTLLQGVSPDPSGSSSETNLLTVDDARQRIRALRAQNRACE